MTLGNNRPTPECGFTYLGVLFGVALVGVALSIGSTVWYQEAKRLRKLEAEWVLIQYESALRRYFNAAPGLAPSLPLKLDELLLDQRYLGVVRHLRKRYTVDCGQRHDAEIKYQPSPSSAMLAIVCPGGEVLSKKHVLLGGAY